jgi:hypothetical protein
MRVVGRKFWTWMSLWMFSFFIKGELDAGQPQESQAQDPSTTTQQHHVPKLHPDTPKKDGRRVKEDTPKKDGGKITVNTPKKDGGKITPYTPKKDGGKRRVTPHVPKKDGGK